VLVSLALLLFMSRPASADQWSFTAFAGMTFHTRTGFVDVDNGVGRRKRALGGSVAWLSDRGFGCEGEIAIVPGLFDGGSGLVPSSRAVTTNFNLLVMPRQWLASRLRLYGTLGIGAIAVRATDVADVFSVRTTLPALNAGGGVLVRVRPRFAVRGDLRYFRTTFRDPPPGKVAIGSWYLQLWRASAGVVLQF